MKILSIETSCDETAISLVDANGGLENPHFRVLGNSLVSQINIHKEYGGVYPMLAKREHAKNLPIILEEVLKQASSDISKEIKISEEKWREIEKILEREEGLFDSFKVLLENVKRPEIDCIAVTMGPGLEPALWVGISFAKALSTLWNIPLIGINHMEGHITSILFDKTDEFLISNSQFSNKNTKIQFPALALLISGGHTELVEIKNWGDYKVIGETVDDAVGEAFDKTARMLELPYPGGPEISKLATKARNENLAHIAKFPRPMIHSKDLNFSFSGLKTSVLYYLRDLGRALTQDDISDIAREFEDTVVDVLLSKTKKAIEEREVKTLIIAGGVISNEKIKEEFLKLEKEFGDLVVKLPTKSLSTDNSLMIAGAAYINVLLYPEILNLDKNLLSLQAQGNLKLGISTLK